MTMTFSHYSSAETIEPYDVEQTDRHFKPRGLWVSVDGEYGWPEWNRDSGYCDTDQQNRFRVEVSEGLLILSSAAAVADFQQEFGRRRYEGDDGVDWPIVAGCWPGIIIAPYQRWWGSPLWYYGWDCASGCIWDASVITSVERVAAEAVAR